MCGPFFKTRSTRDFTLPRTGFLNQRTMAQKSLISVISIGELTKIGTAMTFFLEIKTKFFFLENRVKIAFLEVKTFFFEIRENTRQTTLTPKWRPFFETEGHRAMGHGNFQKTFKKHKMGHGYRKVENH